MGVYRSDVISRVFWRGSAQKNFFGSSIFFPACQNSRLNPSCFLRSFAQTKTNPGFLVEASANASLERVWDWRRKQPFVSTKARSPDGSIARKSGVYRNPPDTHSEHGSYIITSQPTNGANLHMKRSSVCDIACFLPAVAYAAHAGRRADRVLRIGASCLRRSG